ncbi:MAG: response regulator [Clostridia bacterium]|nr:response regulator [Clostridia bacterium]
MPPGFSRASVTGRRLLAVLCVFAIFLAAAPHIALAELPESIVKVGYYENEVFQEGAEEGAIKTGYAYEYYRKISEYTGWKYEYVYGDYSDLYQMLLDGRIDLLAGLAWKEERAGLIGYPSLPMGNETYSLVKHSTAGNITTNPSTFSGKTIGVLESAMVDALNAYLDRNHVTAAVKVYTSYTALFAAFDAGLLDIIAAEGDGAYGRDNAEVLTPFGASDYFLCVSIDRPDLLAELNDAQAALTAEEPNYLHSLSTKYYPVSISARAFSAAEKEWIRTHDALRIGYLENYMPYSGTDEQGQATGIVTDIIPEILRSLGVANISVSYTGYESYDRMIADMSAMTIDAAFPVGGGLYFSEENGIYQSAPVASASTELVYKGEYSDATTQHFAVNENNRMQYYFVRTNFPDSQITLYPSIDACLEAVLSGRVNCTTLNGLRANDILKNARYKDLAMYQLLRKDDRCFGVEIGNEGLLKLLNRGINMVGGDYAQNISYRYTHALYSYSLLDMVREHMALFGSLLLAVGLMVIFFLVRDQKRTKKQMAEKEAAGAALEKKNRELEASQKELAETDDIISDAGFGTWHIILEEGKPPRMRGNAKMMELLGIPVQSLTEEEVYNAWYSRILPEDVASVQKSVSEMLEGRLTENIYRWEHPEKGVMYVRCGGTAQVNESHRQLLRGYHSDVTDIVREEQTQKETLQNALAAAEHANRAKTTFLNNMSHDIRTPMNAIVGFTALAASHIDNREQVTDYLGKISVSSQHLLSLINDVLDMSRIESGKMTLEEKEVHLPDLIHDLRTIIQTNISAKQLELFVDTQNVVHEDIIADKLRLNQVLLNILSNAIKFTPSGGKISFHVTEEEAQSPDTANYVFRIRDTGIGMSREFQQTIFEAFTREKSSTVSGIQGTGLGMAITKNIVDMMGGRITVRSEEGKGTEFVVNLPCRLGSCPAAFEAIPELEGLRALVADDDTDTCLSVCSMLRKIGMRPDWTNYGKEAVVRAKEAMDHGDEFRAYIIDWQMPDLNGIETVRRIRKVIGDLAPIIILTAYDWADIEKEAREAGVTAFCSKPVFLSELRNVMAEPFCKEKEEEKKTEKKDFSGRRVLLTEDNEMNQMIAEAILTEAGFTVEIAGDGEVAVEKMKAAPPGYYDIILMDIQMPRMDGYEAAKRIRELPDPAKAGIPIVAVTANAFEEDRNIALAAGMNGHLAKPYDIPKMMDTLEKLLK